MTCKTALFLFAILMLAACGKSDSTIDHPVRNTESDGWVINLVDRNLGFCEASLKQRNFSVKIIPDMKGNVSFLLQDDTNKWSPDSDFFVYVNGQQNFGSLNTRKSDGSFFTSTNNTVSFEYPFSILNGNSMQIDLYNFATGNHIKSYPLRNKKALFHALQRCQEGIVPSLPDSTPPRQPRPITIDSDLPKTEEELFRALNGSAPSQIPVTDDKNSWEFKKLNDGTCYMFLMTKKAKFGIGRDNDPDNVVLDIQNKSKRMEEVYIFETSIDGEVRRSDFYEARSRNQVPIIMQRFVPLSTFDKSEVIVKVLISDPEDESELWDSFIIPSPKNLDESLDKCSA